MAHWRLRPYRLGSARSEALTHWRPPDEWAYCYLLGLYLGDGHLVLLKSNTASLRLYLDERYALLTAAARNAIARTAPRASVRSFHKPGCDRTYEYPRYFFSNLSDDIREIFCTHCDLLGIHWTRSRYRDISVSRRRSVALLDSFIGPKS